MNRLLIAGLVVLAVASIVVAQSPSPATVRTAAGEKPMNTIRQNGQVYVSVDDVLSAIGGNVSADANGFRVTLNGITAAYGPDSRFGVVKDDLIEMPAPPIGVEGKSYVPWQFFQGFLRISGDSDVSWNDAARVLQIRPLQREALTAQVSVANVQGISKIVIGLSGPADYGITKEPGAYTIRFRNPIHAPFPEQTYEDPYISKVTFTGSDLRIQLTSPDVAGDAYKLDNPFRIVLDLRKAAAQASGATGGAMPLRPSEVPGIRTIVIDPGHGGREVGAIGPNGMMEKDATLAICRKLQNALASKLGARVILTRNDDSVVSLDQRTAVANQYKADLFLSVHLNAAAVKGAHGSEVYFLSVEASDEQAKKAAEVENAAARSAVVPQTGSPDLKLILWDLAQQEYLNESNRFAQVIQEEMNQLAGVQNRGVKQAPFKVLVGATMPAALVEVAFISNPEEEAKLQKDDFQNTVVAALERAVERYKTDYETRIGGNAPKPAPAAGNLVTPPAPPTPVAQRSGT
jgi:N-acetylmuramoyl-L-alanine amidase